VITVIPCYTKRYQCDPFCFTLLGRISQVTGRMLPLQHPLSTVPSLPSGPVTRNSQWLATLRNRIKSTMHSAGGGKLTLNFNLHYPDFKSIFATWNSRMKINKRKNFIYFFLSLEDMNSLLGSGQLNIVVDERAENFPACRTDWRFCNLKYRSFNKVWAGENDECVLIKYSWCTEQLRVSYHFDFWKDSENMERLRADNME